MLNRLQFLHNNKEFLTKEDAIEHLKYYRDSLYGEPIVMKYKGNDADNPSLLLIIGAEGEEGDTKKNFFVIDYNQVVTDIDNLEDNLAKAIASLSLATKDTTTLKLTANKTEEGTELSGDVKLSVGKVDTESSRIKRNGITTLDDGLFIFVDMEYDEDEHKITFSLNDKDKTFTLPEEDYVVSCNYDIKTESLVITRKSGTVVTCSLSPLLNEWTVEGDKSTTPVILTKERVIYDPDTTTYRDILRGDVRIDSTVKNNILKKNLLGNALYVDGSADNIMYDSTQTVKTVMDANKLRISYDDANMIYMKEDGIYATVGLTYDESTNKLFFTRSDENGGVETKAIQLVGVKFFDDISYHPSTHTLEILYTDNTGTLQKISLDLTDLLAGVDWITQNDGHNVKIAKVTKEGSSNAQVSADVKISELEDNILTDKDHTLYVKGTSSNIKHGTKTVEEVLNELSDDVSGLTEDFEEVSEKILTATTSLQSVVDALNAEIARAKNAEQTNAENIAYEEGVARNEESKLKTLIETETSRAKTAEQTNADNLTYETSVSRNEEAKLNTQIEAEVERAEEREDELEAMISGASTNLSNKIDEVKAEADELAKTSALKVLDTPTVDLSDDTTNGHELSANVKLSAEDDNILKANADGLFAKTTLEYDNTNNTLHFTASDGTDKVIQLLTQSLADNIYYDPITESIIFTWVKDGVEKKISVNVRQLIDEWETKDTDTVTLTREYNYAKEGESIAAKDVLTADVKICPTSIHDDNILVIDNGLYVSGAQIEGNTVKIAEILDEIGDLSDLVTPNKKTLVDAINDAYKNSGTTITVDKALDSGSTNPVENKAITLEIIELKKRIAALEAELLPLSVSLVVSPTTAEYTGADVDVNISYTAKYSSAIVTPTEVHIYQDDVEIPSSTTTVAVNKLGTTTFKVVVSYAGKTATATATHTQTRKATIYYGFNTAETITDATVMESMSSVQKDSVEGDYNVTIPLGVTGYTYFFVPSGLTITSAILDDLLEFPFATSKPTLVGSDGVTYITYRSEESEATGRRDTTDKIIKITLK